RDLLSQSGRRGFGHDAGHDVDAEAGGERKEDAGLQAAGRGGRLLRVYVQAMLLVQNGTGVSRHYSVEDTGTTHLCGNQPRDWTEQDPSGSRGSDKDTQSYDGWVD